MDVLSMVLPSQPKLGALPLSWWATPEMHLSWKVRGARRSRLEKLFSHLKPFQLKPP